jgi:hypothetical protein
MPLRPCLLPLVSGWLSPPGFFSLGLRPSVENDLSGPGGSLLGTGVRGCLQAAEYLFALIVRDSESEENCLRFVVAMYFQLQPYPRELI